MLCPPYAGFSPNRPTGKKNVFRPVFDASRNQNICATIRIGREIRCLPYMGFVFIYLGCIYARTLGPLRIYSIFHRVILLASPNFKMRQFDLIVFYFSISSNWTPFMILWLFHLCSPSAPLIPCFLFATQSWAGKSEKWKSLEDISRIYFSYKEHKNHQEISKKMYHSKVSVRSFV